MPKINILFSDKKIISYDNILEWYRENYYRYSKLNMYRSILKEYGVSEEDICSGKSMEVLLLVSLLYSDNKLFPRELLSERSVSWVDAIAFSDTITVVAESCINLEMLLKERNYCYNKGSDIYQIFQGYISSIFGRNFDNYEKLLK